MLVYVIKYLLILKSRNRKEKSFCILAALTLTNTCSVSHFKRTKRLCNQLLIKLKNGNQLAGSLAAGTKIF